MVASYLFSKFLEKKFQSLIAGQKQPYVAQNKAFKRVQRHLKGSQVHRHFSLGQYKSLKDFVKRAPVTSYSDYQNWVNSVADDGAQNVLFKDQPRFIGLSSGTTGHNSKQIIYNDKMIKAFEKFQFSFGSIIEKYSPYRFLSHKRLTWGSTPIVDYNKQGVQRGYVSGYLATRTPRIIKSKNFPSPELCCIQDMTEKLDKVTASLRHQDIRLISGVPSYIVNLLQELKVRWGVENLTEVWPNLSLVIYSGTDIHSYKKQIQDCFSQPLQFLGCYIATECPMGYEIPSPGNSQHGLYSFHLGEAVFTFRKIEDENSPLLTIDELKEGDEVEILLTTPNGLVNYRIGDCLRIKSVEPFIRFEVMGRLGQGVNIATEKVTLKELNQVIAQAAEEFQIRIKHYFVYPWFNPDGRPCYRWNLVTDRPDMVDLETIETFLDNALMRLNGDYKEAREELFHLGRPSAQLVKEEVIQRYFERDSHRGQLKMKNVFDAEESFLRFIENLGFSRKEAIHGAF